MTYSEILITINTPFLENWEMSIIRVQSGGGTTTQTFIWKDTPVNPFEVQTSFSNALTASNLGLTFLDENPTGYQSFVSGDVLTIQSETLGENWLGVSVKDENGNLLSPDTVYSVVFNNYADIPSAVNVELALVRSPHYVSTNFEFPTTTKAVIELTVWSGDIGVLPSTPTYQLTRVRPTANAIDLDTNLSLLIRSEIEPKPNLIHPLPVQLQDSDVNSVKWVFYRVEFIDSESTVTPVEGYLSALDGYGYHSEGANPSKPTNKILSSNILSRKVSRNSIIMIPFLNDGTYSDIDTTGNDGLSSTISFVTPLLSFQYVKYLLIDCSQITDTFLTIEFSKKGAGLQQVFIEISDECKFTPKNVIFKNKFGAFESMSFFRKNMERIEVSKEKFVNQFTVNKSYDTSIHQFKDINFESTESITLNTGFISENENARVKELLLSDQVWIYENESLIPVSVKSSSLEFKTRLNDKLINYTVDFDYAFNTIQNV